MAIDLVTSRMLIREAARKLDNNHEDKSLFSAMAKAHATEKCYHIVDEAL
jgi:isobutyryl-CoA dehydrogenase